MAFVIGALGSLAPKLLQLLQDEYQLQKGVKTQVEFLARELKSMHAALCKVAEVPHDELDPQVKLWASEVREASYHMEDVLDTFLLHADGGNTTADADKQAKFSRLLEKMGKMFSLSRIKARREIAGTIEDIARRVDEISRRRDRYRVDDYVANYSVTATRIDPRLLSLHTKASDLVGIDKPRYALIKELSQGNDDASDMNMKIVSIFGSGGLGKTTLAKVVYDKLAMDMNIHCKAFVPVGQNPDLQKLFRDILFEFDKECYMNKVNFMALDERQLMDEIQGLLKEKRYIIVIDDIWEVSTWKAIRIALKENNLGSKIIITTRCSDVACSKEVHYSYKLMPLLHESSQNLFYGRIFGSKEKCPENFLELSEKILMKCGGVPLAIITLSSLLADKLEDIIEWVMLCNVIGSGLNNSDNGVCNMRKILSLSYYDLPSHLKTCFLYLSMFPEDYLISKDQLIWMWVAEGFIQPQQNCDDLFELGETYFNELIKRSLIQPVGHTEFITGIYGCHVHDMILDRTRCLSREENGTYGCHVHDMILDLICCLSREENFVTTSEKVISSETKQIHRSSLNNMTTCPKMDMSRVRSLAMFHPSMDSFPSLLPFGGLRVLILEDCYIGGSDGTNLNVGNLIHLRYLGLVRNNGLNRLPEGIERLQYLQVLKIKQLNSILSVRPIFMLKRLVCLEGIFCYPTPGNLLRNLASLQVLRSLYLNKDSVDVVVELGHLTNLTELRIEIEVPLDQSPLDLIKVEVQLDALISSLDKLRRLRELIIYQDPFRPQRIRLIDWEKWTPPLHLRMLKLFLHSGTPFRTLPKWINPTSLPRLTELALSDVDIVRPKDIQILGKLPSLSSLWLCAGTDNTDGPLQKFVLSADAFPRAITCRFFHVVTVPSMFPRGAMSRVEQLYFCLRARDFFSNDGLDFGDLSLEHFSSLQRASFDILGCNLEQVEKVKDTLKLAADAHHNHPSINFHTVH